MRRIFLAVNAVISLILVSIILYFVGVEQVLSELQHLDLQFLLFSLISLFMMDVVMAYRIQILLEGLVHEAKPARPGQKAVWDMGHWNWTGHNWVWVRGHWIKSPKGKWVAGNWEKRRRGHVWVPGHWKK